MAPLYATALRGPIGKAVELFAMFPAKLQKFSSVQVGGFSSKEGFKAPLQVGTIPGIQPVSARNRPVIAKCIPHVLLIVTRPRSESY